MPAINGVAKPASPRCARRSKTGEAKSQTDPLNSRIDGLLATVSLGAGYRRINRLPATPSIGVASHEFLLRAALSKSSLARKSHSLVFETRTGSGSIQIGRAS